MKRMFLLLCLALAMALSSAVAFALPAPYEHKITGDPLPDGAQLTNTFEYTVNQGWVLTSNAQAYNSKIGNPAGFCNSPEWVISFTNHASMAQWIDWDIDGNRKDWRILKPGDYASDCISLRVGSNADVNVTFSEFTNLLYDDESVAGAPPIEAFYTVRDGRQECVPGTPCNPGWPTADKVPAKDEFKNIDQLNGFTFGIPATQSRAGSIWKIWSMLSVGEDNLASDYTGTGTITLSITNQKYWLEVDPLTESQGNGFSYHQTRIDKDITAPPTV